MKTCSVIFLGAECANLCYQLFFQPSNNELIEFFSIRRLRVLSVYHLLPFIFSMSWLHWFRFMADKGGGVRT